MPIVRARSLSGWDNMFRFNQSNNSISSSQELVNTSPRRVTWRGVHQLARMSINEAVPLLYLIALSYISCWGPLKGRFLGDSKSEDVITSLFFFSIKHLEARGWELIVSVCACVLKKEQSALGNQPLVGNTHWNGKFKQNLFIVVLIIELSRLRPSDLALSHHVPIKKSTLLDFSWAILYF